MYIYDKESLSKFGDSKHLIQIAWNRQFLVTYVWNCQLFVGIPYEANAALSNTCIELYLPNYQKY